MIDEKKFKERMKILLGGESAAAFAKRVGCDPKTIRNALEGKIPGVDILDKSLEGKHLISWLVGEIDGEHQAKISTASVKGRGQAVVADGCFAVNIEQSQGGGCEALQVYPRERRLLESMRRYASEAMWLRIEAMLAEEADRYR